MDPKIGNVALGEQSQDVNGKGEKRAGIFFGQWINASLPKR